MTAPSTETIPTLADDPRLRAALAERDGLPAELTAVLDAATAELRAASDRLGEVRRRNATTASRIAELSAEIEKAPADRLADLRANRHALMSDHAFSGEDRARATGRLAAAHVAFTDALLAVLAARGRTADLQGAHARVDDAQSRLIRNPHAAPAVLAGHARAFVAAYDRMIELAPGGTADLVAEQAAIGAVVGLHAPVGQIGRSFSHLTGEERFVWDRVRPRLLALRPALVDHARRTVEGG